MTSAEPQAPPPPLVRNLLGRTQRGRIALIVVIAALLATAVAVINRPQDTAVRSEAPIDSTTTLAGSEASASPATSPSTSVTSDGATSDTLTSVGTAPTSATGHADGGRSTDPTSVPPGDASGTGDATGPGQTAPQVTTTTVCIESYDPGCGPFRWTTGAAPNQPLVIDLSIFGPAPVAGQSFTVRIAVSDGDAGTFRHGMWVTEEGDYPPILACSFSGSEAGFGPWTPPAPNGGSRDFLRANRQLEPGTYWVSVCVTSTAWKEGPAMNTLERCPGDGTTAVFEGWLCRDPYASFATARLQIEVLPA